MFRRYHCDNPYWLHLITKLVSNWNITYELIEQYSVCHPFTLCPRAFCTWTQSSSQHYSDVIMVAMVSPITSLTIVYSTVYQGTDQRKHQNSSSLDFVRGYSPWPVNSPHKGSVTRKIFPFEGVIINDESPWRHTTMCALNFRIFELELKTQKHVHNLKKDPWCIDSRKSYT